MNIHKYKGLEFDPTKMKETTSVLPKPQIITLGEAKGDAKTPSFLMPKIEVIHAGKTRNNTRYLADKLKGDPQLQSGVYSWLYPYPKPVIMNHDTNTAPTGRIHAASFTKDTKAGKEGIIAVPKITDPNAIESILDGRLMTVSIGATTDAAICNICGTDIIEEGFCGHMKGESYDGNMCEWIVGNVYFDELSWVNVPADQTAMVIDTGKILTAAQSTESINLDLTEWVRNKPFEKLSESLETSPTTEKEGENTLKTVEELQIKVNELTADLEKVITEKNGIQVELDQAKSTIESQQAELTVAQTSLGESTTKVTELEESVQTLEADRAGLLTKNTELASEIHTATAERVVDLKVALGKVAERDEALTQHVGRSKESLLDTLADLLAEAKAGIASIINTPRVPGTVTNPAGALLNDGKEPNSLTDVAPKATEPVKPLGKEDALKGLFGGPGRQINKAK